MEARFAKLPDWLKTTFNAARVEVTGLTKLSGGAIQENWHLLAQIDGANLEWVLRTDAPSTLNTSHSRPEEYALLGIAHNAGVRAPKPVALCEDASIIGAPFYLMEKAPGIAQARKITRNPDLPAFGPALAHQLGQELAKLHKISPPVETLAFLPGPPEKPAQSRIDHYRLDLDALPEHHPVLEYTLNWLEDHQPRAQTVALCHSDYRTGNFMVHNGQLTAILDWEFAGWSDPMEDIGWICARCWRFGNDDLTVGGIAQLASFIDGYQSISTSTVDTAQIPYWQVMAELRWAIIALQQAERCASGEEMTLELALSGPLAAEMELNILNLIQKAQ